MAHHWRKPERPMPAEKTPSILAELVELFRSSFRTPGHEKNHWAMPFSATPTAFRRRFAGRKRA
jgi:hypothetical protein